MANLLWSRSCTNSLCWFTKTIGSNNAKDIEPNILERSLRLAYEEAYFHDTQLYLDICTWENENQPFIVLPRNI